MGRGDLKKRGKGGRKGYRTVKKRLLTGIISREEGRRHTFLGKKKRNEPKGGRWEGPGRGSKEDILRHR